MMNIESVSQTSSPAISPVLESRLVNHRAHLGSKYAFLFNQEVINRAKNLKFQKPPRRDITVDHDHKLELETCASSGLESTGLSSNDQNSYTDVHSIKLDTKVPDRKERLYDRVLRTLVEFEEFLNSNSYLSAESLSRVRSTHRWAVGCLQRSNGILGFTPELTLAVIAYTNEKLNIGHKLLSKFFDGQKILARFNKLRRVRSSKAYKVLKGKKCN